MVEEKVKAAYLILYKAIAISAEFHAGQVDKAGKPYRDHPRRVADAVMSTEDFDYIDDDQQIFLINAGTVAYLHDVLEDTKCTEEYLKNQGIPEDIIEGVKSVTRNEGESYGDFVKRAAQNPFGKIVKLHDLMDNLDVKRLEHLTTEDLNRVNKYLKWYHYLMQVCKYE